jgi:hypothetical protein
MIASPGDVSEERDVIRTTLHDWNDINSVNSRIMLAPLGWDSHSSPELGVRPQELINERVLKNCDLLIGVFWTRLGSPTGNAQSGTVEEIREHLAAGKPAMIYFSSKPAAPDTIDPEQYSRLKTFKEWCKSQGLIEEFENIEQFRAKLAKQLPLCLSNNAYLKSLVAPSSDTPSAIVAPQQPTASLPRLSVDAATLLRTAGQKDGGTILKMAYIGGRVIQAGGKSFGGTDPRESARWENALNELIANNLIVARGYKDQVFELTHEGWRVADTL